MWSQRQRRRRELRGRLGPFRSRRRTQWRQQSTRWKMRDRRFRLRRRPRLSLRTGSIRSKRLRPRRRLERLALSERTTGVRRRGRHFRLFGLLCEPKRPCPHRVLLRTPYNRRRLHSSARSARRNRSDRLLADPGRSRRAGRRKRSNSRRRSLAASRQPRMPLRLIRLRDRIRVRYERRLKRRQEDRNASSKSGLWNTSSRCLAGDRRAKRKLPRRRRRPP